MIKAIITGATGMVGKGVLLECLESAEVAEILVINRHPLEIKHPKLKEIIHSDFYDWSAIEEELRGYNACFFCLGVSAFRMSEQDYTRITYELTMGFARTLLKVSQEMTFCFVSGEGTDSSEKGRFMWARVKGRTENELLKMPFKAAYMFRPGYIHPMKGLRSRTPVYNLLYVFFKPMYPVLKVLFPRNVTNTQAVGKAMIAVMRKGYHKRIADSGDINLLAGEPKT